MTVNQDQPSPATDYTATLREMRKEELDQTTGSPGWMASGFPEHHQRRADALDAALVLKQRVEQLETWLKEQETLYVKRVDTALADPNGFANSRWLGGESNALGRVRLKFQELLQGDR